MNILTYTVIKKEALHESVSDVEYVCAKYFAYLWLLLSISTNDYKRKNYKRWSSGGWQTFITLIKPVSYNWTRKEKMSLLFCTVFLKPDLIIYSKHVTETNSCASSFFWHVFDVTDSVWTLNNCRDDNSIETATKGETTQRSWSSPAEIRPVHIGF